MRHLLTRNLHLHMMCLAVLSFRSRGTFTHKVCLTTRHYKQSGNTNCPNSTKVLSFSSPFTRINYANAWIAIGCKTEKTTHTHAKEKKQPTNVLFDQTFKRISIISTFALFTTIKDPAKVNFFFQSEGRERTSWFDGSCFAPSPGSAIKCTWPP